MTVDVEVTDLLGVVHQLRTLATFLENCIPTERDADLPPHQRLAYVTRDRSFSDAFETKDRRRKENAKKGGVK